MAPPEGWIIVTADAGTQPVPCRPGVCQVTWSQTLPSTVADFDVSVSGKFAPRWTWTAPSSLAVAYRATAPLVQAFVGTGVGLGVGDGSGKGWATGRRRPRPAARRRRRRADRTRGRRSRRSRAASATEHRTCQETHEQTTNCHSSTPLDEPDPDSTDCRRPVRAPDHSRHQRSGPFLRQSGHDTPASIPAGIARHRRHRFGVRLQSAEPDAQPGPQPDGVRIALDAPTASATPQSTPQPDGSPEVPIVPVADFRTIATSIDQAGVAAILAGTNKQFTTLELVSADADGILAALGLTQPSVASRLVLAPTAAALEADLDARRPAWASSAPPTWDRACERWAGGTCRSSACHGSKAWPTGRCRPACRRPPARRRSTRRRPGRSSRAAT